MASIASIRPQDVTEVDLAALVGTDESRTLEVKRDMYGTSDAAKREFLKDVTALANSIGGDLLIGVTETKGRITAVLGIDDNPDASILRLEQLAANSVTPRIPGLQNHAVVLRSGKVVLVVRVPRSPAGPHRVELDDYRFWYRTNRGTERLDVDQLRSAFLAEPEFAQRVRAYRVDRVARIAADSAPIKLLAKTSLVVHAFPRDVFSAERIPGANLQPLVARLLPPGATALRDIRFNLEGIVGYAGAESGIASAYLQFGRDGSYEGVRTNIVSENASKVRSVEVEAIERQVRDAVWNALGVLKELNRGLPCTIFVSLCGVEGAFYLPSTSAQSEAEVVGFDRSIVLAPELIIHEYPLDKAALSRLLFPLLDEIANAAGWSRSPHRD